MADRDAATGIHRGEGAGQWLRRSLGAGSKRALLRLSAGIACAVCASAAWAVSAPDQPAGEAFQISASQGFFEDPAVASDAAGNFTTVWGSSTTRDVLVKRYSASGAAIGSVTNANTNFFYASQGTVAVNASGQTVVAWTVIDTNNKQIGIGAQRFSADGTAVGSNLMAFTAASSPSRPAVSIDASGNFILACQSLTPDGTRSLVRAQRFDASGQTLGADFLVSDSAVTQVGASVGVADDQSFVIAWQEGEAANGEIFARRFDATGAAKGNALGVNTTMAGAQLTPQLRVRGNGEFIVTWASDGQDGDGSGIFARRFDALGQPQASEFRVNTTTVLNQSEPALTIDRNGNFVIVWSSTLSSSAQSDQEIRMQPFDASGSPRGSEQLIYGGPFSPRGMPSVAANAQGDFVAAFQVLTNSGNQVIYARRYIGPENVDLAAVLSDSLDPVAAGNDVAYALFITNNHAADSTTPSAGQATGLKARFDFSGGAFDGAGGTGWSCTGRGPVDCSYDAAVLPTQSATALNLYLRANPGVASATVTASVVAQQYDANPTNDSATQSTTVGGATAVPGSLQFASASYSVSENGGALLVTVNRIGGSDGAVSVRLRSSDGQALAGSDYGATDAVLSWANGDAAPKSFSVPIVDDAVAEPSKTFALGLSDVTGGAAPGAPVSSTVTILDDDTAPAAARGSLRFSATSFSAAEGAVAELIVFRSGGSSGTASVDYATSGGNATEGRDYTGTKGTLTWADGDAAPKRILVTTLADTEVEPDKVVNVTLGNAQGAALGEVAAATLTIINDDFASTEPVVVKDSGGGAFGGLSLLVLPALMALRRRRRA